jgi:hypothetical protein
MRVQIPDQALHLLGPRNLKSVSHGDAQYHALQVLAAKSAAAAALRERRYAGHSLTVYMGDHSIATAGNDVMRSKNVSGLLPHVEAAIIRLISGIRSGSEVPRADMESASQARVVRTHGPTAFAFTFRNAFPVPDTL